MKRRGFLAGLLGLPLAAKAGFTSAEVSMPVVEPKVEGLLRRPGAELVANFEKPVTAMTFFKGQPIVATGNQIYFVRSVANSKENFDA